MAKQNALVLSVAGLAIVAAAALFAIHARRTPPASADDLRTAVATIYPSFRRHAVASPIVSFRLNGERRYVVLTAGHVIDEIRRDAMRAGGYIGFGFPSAAQSNKVRRIERPIGEVASRRANDPRYDLGWYEIGDGMEYAESLGCAISSIDLEPLLGWAAFCEDARVLRGVEVATVAEYGRYGIGEGTELLCFCADPGVDNRNDGYIWPSVVKTIAGRIVKLNEKVPVVRNGRAAGHQVAHLVEGHVINGNSGGAVFAMPAVGGGRRPVLIGVVSGQFCGDDTKSYVAPIDAFVDELKAAKRREVKK